MVPLADIRRFLDGFAPPALSEEWDNVGLLVGDAEKSIRRVMTCLTITPESCQEAVDQQADIIVTHHPLPFKPLRRLTSESTPGRLLLQLIRAGIAVYSPHTAFDSAAEGINQQLAGGIGLVNIQPLVPASDGSVMTLGSGRWGKFTAPVSISEVASRLKSFLKIPVLQAVAPANASISTVAIACGSGGSFLEHAQRRGIELLITGEASFHTCLEAEATGVHLLLTGHFASERFAVERLAEILTLQFPPLQVWASQQEADPLRNL